MISVESVFKYRQFARKGKCFLLPSTCTAIIVDKNDVYYCEPRNETDASFLDRIERSQKCGRKLFYEEWEVVDPADLVDD